MLLSMTGYGRAEARFGDKLFVAEVRSLNSKLQDVKLKLPAEYRDREMELRKILAQGAQRGKIDASLEVSSEGGSDSPLINAPLLRAYAAQVQALAQELALPQEGLLATLLRLPNVVSSSSATMPEAEWDTVQAVLGEALAQMEAFRRSEGAATEADLRERVGNIRSLMAGIGPHEAARIEKVRQRLQQALDEYVGRENIDQNRFEQELILYLEKFDINEEKVRLEQHCQYFLDQLDDDSEWQKGRKLNFISQEMGREINTIGSKANSSDIQRLVVQMKDELEKLKEQSANVL